LVWATTVTDPTAPINPTKVGRLEINPQNASLPSYGNSIQDIHSVTKFIPPPTVSKIYWSYWFKYLPGFATYALQFKQTEMFYSGSGNHIIATNGSVVGPWYMEFYNTGPAGPERIGGAQTITTGQWYHVEVIITYATRHEQMFVNGQPYIDAIANTGPVGSPIEFGYVWVYGGVGGPGVTQLDRSIYMYHDALYMSYVP